MFKKTLAFSAGLAMAAAPAFANDVADNCRAYAAEHGAGDASGCDCLAEAAAGDPALAAALLKIKTPDDAELADEATKAAIGKCYPPAEAPA